MFYISEMNNNWLLATVLSFCSNGGRPSVPKWHPNRAIYRPLLNGGSTGGDCNRWVNYVSVVRAESHYPSVVLWFSTGFLYLNPKLTFLNRFKKPPSVNSQTHETHVFAHVSFLDPGPARLTSASAGQGHPSGKTHILTYVALLVREIYFVFII